MPQQFTNPQEIAEAGQRIFDKRRHEFETLYPGQFVVIDIETEAFYPAPHPEEALSKAREANPRGKFHLIKVGSAGAFRVSYSLNARRQWLFRQRQPCN